MPTGMKKKLRSLNVKGSYVVSALIVIVLGLWLSTGQIVVGGQAPEPGSAEAERAAQDEAQRESPEAPFRVQVQEFVARERVATLTLRGRTMANQRVEMKAEVAGQVEALPVPKGSKVTQGNIICKIEDGVRPARVLQAKALLAQAELDHEAASKLSTSGYAAETRVRALQASLDAAKAALKEAELNLARTEIKAPFDGVIEDELVKTGDYLNVGNPCVTVTSIDPILIVGQVSERDVASLGTGMPAQGRLVTGEEFKGRIRFISSAAEPETRTFRVEIEVANPDGTLRNGVTARMDIPLPPVRAHRLSPSYLTLNDSGEVGIRSVDEDGRVRFLAVEILDDEPGGVWVAGLPDKVMVITAGQDFVGEGEKVAPVMAKAESAS